MWPKVPYGDSSFGHTHEKNHVWLYVYRDTFLVLPILVFGVVYKGCGSSEHWITLYSCTLDLMYASVHHFLNKKRNLLSIAKYFLFYDFSWRYLCKTWWYHENFRNQRKCFQNIHLSIMTKNSLSKRHTYVYIWCQDTICFQLVSSHKLVLKGVIDWGGARFHKKFHGSSNVSLWRWSRYGYVSLNEFFMSFSINSKSFKNSYFSTHNHPPSWIEGEHKRIVPNIKND